MQDRPLSALSACDIAQAVSSRRVSAREVTAAALGRAARLDPTLARVPLTLPFSTDDLLRGLERALR